MFNPLSIRSGFGLFVLLLASSVLAQGEPSVSQAQSECKSIAQQQTGYNPNAAPAPTQPQTGGRAKGAAAGAMLGAAKGQSKANQYEHAPDRVTEEYTENQMKDAAKAGAVVGAAKQRQQRQQATVAQQQESASANAYNQAYGSCMAGKGFPGQ